MFSVWRSQSMKNDTNEMRTKEGLGEEDFFGSPSQKFCLLLLLPRGESFATRKITSHHQPKYSEVIEWYIKTASRSYVVSILRKAGNKFTSEDMKEARIVALNKWNMPKEDFGKCSTRFFWLNIT
jgi:hypothetical protein